MTTQIILLERVENLGEIGDLVSVKPGYARNFLLPQKKALRATKSNIAYFEAQKKSLLAENDKKKAAAEKQAKKLSDLKVPLIRAASESGQLYGSVTSRDIAREISEVSGESVNRSMVQINTNYKTLGLFPIDVSLHPEVKVSVTINIARTDEEAKIQAETGKALVATSDNQIEEEEETPLEQLEEVLEEDALAAEKEKIEAEQSEASDSDEEEAA